MDSSTLVCGANGRVLLVYSTAGRLHVGSGAIAHISPGRASLILGGTSGSGAPIVIGAQISASILVGGATSGAIGIASGADLLCLVALGWVRRILCAICCGAPSRASFVVCDATSSSIGRAPSGAPFVCCTPDNINRVEMALASPLGSAASLRSNRCKV